MVEELDDAPVAWGPDRGTEAAPSLEQRAAGALDEIQSISDALAPRASVWRNALRDVHAHIYGERSSERDPLTSTDLIDAYRRLYDELLTLSAMLDPDISAPDPEVPE